MLNSRDTKLIISCDKCRTCIEHQIDCDGIDYKDPFVCMNYVNQDEE